MTRERDELELRVLELDRQRILPKRIGSMLKITGKQVSHILERIRLADVKHDPENAAEWWQTNHPPRKRGRQR